MPLAYALRSKSDRLTDVLDRAGGLTPQAYANGIRFYRRENNAGRVGLKLAEVLKDRRHKDNIVLADGDSLYIPPYLPTVRVEGAVNSPGSVTFVQGEGLDYYLSAAGGVSFRGDKGRVIVPLRDTTSHSNTAAVLAAIGTIVASLTTIAVVVVNHP